MLPLVQYWASGNAGGIAIHGAQSHGLKIHGDALFLIARDLACQIHDREKRIISSPFHPAPKSSRIGMFYKQHVRRHRQQWTARNVWPIGGMLGPVIGWSLFNLTLSPW